MMDSNLKRSIILEHYQNPHGRGLIDDDTYLKTNMNNESCIDELNIMVKVEDNIIKDIKFDGEACALCISSASIMVDTLKGKTVEETENILQNFLNMAKEKEYDKDILERFNYNVKITPWLQEGINQAALVKAKIGYYPGGDQITIPHFDKDNRFIGLRGRTLCKEEGERFGKYRPLKVNKILYNHPLGMNLYGFNWTKNNIALMKKAIIFESEKAVLLYGSYFGWENNITVACCGSNISNYQMQLLLDVGAEEIIIAFDRQFQEIGDKEFKHLKLNLMKLYNKYKNFAKITFILDKNMITDYKSSPIDEGPEKFL